MPPTRKVVNEMKAAFASIMGAALISASAESDGVDVGEFDGWGRIIIDASANGTVDFEIEHSDDDVTYEAFDKVSFDQVSNAAASYQVKAVDMSGMKKFARVKTTLGTATAVYAAVTVCGPQQYLG